ncbi:MAG: hypothetical protein AAFZ15_22045 [Bacteroidota bacterium]
MKNNLFFTVLFSCVLILFSCNPDCDSLVGLQLSSTLNPSGYEVVISADPPSSLQGRRIFFNDSEVETTFVDGHGIKVKVPEGISGNVELRIEDPDCVDFVSFDYTVVGESFFNDNPEYIFPPTPEIIIPNVPADFPPSIENAWLHPINVDYCFWFKFLPDTLGHCTKFIDPINSFEQSTCGSADRLYSNNPLSGRVEPDGSVFVTVNRPGGTEDFTGLLINPADVPEIYHGWQELVCDNTPVSASWDASFKNRDFMMLLTSKSTGRQLLIYQQGVPRAPIDCL